MAYTPESAPAGRLPALFAATAVATAIAVAGTASAAQADPLAWSYVDAPTGGSRLSFNSIAPIDDDSVWVAGRDVDGAVAQHWDGASWKETRAKGMTWFQDADFTSDTDGWAVGGGAEANSGAAHWDGSAWTVTPTPMPDTTDTTPWLTAVDAFASDDVWAAGNTDWIGGGVGSGQGFFEHWDGAQWTLVTVNLPGNYLSTELWDVHVVAADDAWAAGTAYTGAGAEPLLLHWDGASWGQVALPGIGGNLTSVTDVDGEVWVAGFAPVDGSPVNAGPLLIREEGDGFVQVKTPDTTSWWYSVVPDGKGGIVAGGYTQSDSAILRSDGETSTIEQGPTGGAYSSVRRISFVPGTGTIWAVGQSDETGAEFVAFTKAS